MAKRQSEREAKREMRVAFRASTAGIMKIEGDFSHWHDSKHLILRFDGGCEFNGTQQAFGYWAYTIEDDQGEHICEGSGELDGIAQSNNTAEWCGLLIGLRAVELVDRSEFAALLIEGDSKLVVNQLVGEWQSKVEPHRIRRDEAWEILGRVGAPWLARWIPREENARCDELAGVVAKERMDSIANPQEAN